METPPTNRKKVWLLVFCAVSFVACIFYVPHKVLGYKDKPTGDTKYLSVFQTEVDSYYRYKLQVDYPAIIFRELVIAIGCVGGYALSTLKK